jgi:hypothetical protein
LAALGVLFAAATGTAAAAQTPASVVDSQWFTGSLIAPSSGPTQAGVYEIEPYAIYTSNSGAYGPNWIHHPIAGSASVAQSEIVLEYSVTDRLTVETVPSFGYAWADQATSRGAGVGDLPIELKYRFVDANRATGAPSVTAFLGMSFPTGAYDRLVNPGLALGSGAYTAREGVLLQSLFVLGGHALRLRLYGDVYEPVASVPLTGISAYGTAQGFHGHASPGISADGGLGIEYGLTQSWVLAFDLVQNYSNTTNVSGAVGNAAIAATKNPSSIAFSLAPAVEYNFNANLGVIAGVQFSVAGRNTSSYIAPQIALSAAF